MAIFFFPLEKVEGEFMGHFKLDIYPLNSEMA